MNLQADEAYYKGAEESFVQEPAVVLIETQVFESGRPGHHGQPRAVPHHPALGSKLSNRAFCTIFRPTGIHQKYGERSKQLDDIVALGLTLDCL